MSEEKETPEERKARREEDDRRWNRQWALDKSIEWCKHINELMGSPNYKVDGDGRTMTSNDVCDIANDFYKWLYKDNKA